MKRIEVSGSLEVYAQEGGYAADGIEVAGEDLGKLIRTATGGDRFETCDWDNCRIIIEVEGEAEDGGIGFIRQAAGR